jgi:hypothetical protein
MKKFIKQIVVAACLLVTILAAKPAHAQGPTVGVWSVANGGIPTTPFTNGTLYNAFPLTNQPFGVQTNVAFVVSVVGVTNIGQIQAGAGALTIQYQGSVDYPTLYSSQTNTSSIWVSDPQLVQTVSILTNIGGTNTGWTNFNLSRYSAIRPYSYTNTSTNLNATNLTIEWFYK